MNVICSTWKLKDLCYAPSIPNFDMHYIDQVMQLTYIYIYIYTCTYTHSRRMHTRAHVQHEWRARARVYAPSPGPIRPLVKASMRARDTCTTCPRNKLSITVISERSRTTSTFSSTISSTYSLSIPFYDY